MLPWHSKPLLMTMYALSILVSSHSNNFSIFMTVSCLHSSVIQFVAFGIGGIHFDSVENFHYSSTSSSSTEIFILHEVWQRKLWCQCLVFHTFCIHDKQREGGREREIVFTLKWTHCIQFMCSI